MPNGRRGNQKLVAQKVAERQTSRNDEETNKERHKEFMTQDSVEIKTKFFM
jgi:hypothetical protein